MSTTESSLPEEAGSSSETRRLLSVTLILALVAAGLAILVFSWLGREVVTGVTPAADEQLRAELHTYASPGLTRFMIAISRFGGPSFLVPMGLGLALAFLIHGWRRGAFLIVITLAGAGLLNTLLKQTFARTRPEAFFDYPLPLSQSFPSGHAIFAASVFGGLAVLLTDRIRRTSLQVLVWVAALAIILLVGISRVYLGVHYPSDVLAGYAVAVFWIVGVALGDRVASHRRSRQRS
jgi:membrane-associated phospholipid phosphatase